MKLNILSWNVRGLKMEDKRNLGVVEDHIQPLGGNRWMGGIWMEAWDKRSWKGEMVESGNQMITCKLSGINVDLIWFLTVVYASCDRNERNETLGGLNFNTTRFPSEKTNCTRLSGAMTDFSSCINELELVDPTLFG
ncbi:hypothetical protein H5410_040887 [Solanum commersonii]|uniref:Uncharacterized protein n=1 Tax=Solanum commersonii TaxID=4109 RepID=A0A9J5XRF4_SOLCO|nr:hypothetical protein H5410_040887 [Solanum commersonii]